MPKIRLDNAFVLLAQCPEGKRRIEYFDTVTTGFTLEVRSNGGKTYNLRYSDKHGAQKQVKIGGFTDMTFDQARKAAKRLRSEVVLGGDPHADKAELKAVPTYAEFADRYLAHVKTYQRSYVTTEQYVRLHVLPRWGKVRLSAIHQADVADWLALKGKTLKPATVEKIRVMFGQSLKLAIRWGVPGITTNPLTGIARQPLNNTVERYLTPEDALRLRGAVERSASPQLKYVVGLLILTGARVSELLHAEWKDINLETRMWRIPMSKTGKARHVPLSQGAVDLLNQVPRWPKCPYVVPNTHTKQPFVSIFGSWKTARKAAGLPDLRIHDLRHSAASFMVNAGIDLFAVGQVLGHSNHKTTMRYAHLSNATLRAAVEAGAGNLNMDWSQTPTSPLSKAHSS